MKQSRKAQWLKNNGNTSKMKILAVVLLFVATCTIAVYSYIHRLETTFLNNTMYYMSEIADHDMKAVDQEINRQWDRLETIGRKLSIERFKTSVNIQQFLNLETNATGFKELMLIDKTGHSYSSNYTINDITKTDWGHAFLKEKKNIVVRSQAKENFFILYSNLMYCVDIDPVTIDNVTYTGIVGKYSIDSVKDSLRLTFFDGQGEAEVVSRDGIVITTDVTQRGISLESILEELQKSNIVSHDSYQDIKTKLSAGKGFDTVYEQKGKTYIMSSKPLENADWLVVVKVPYSVSSSQTMTFLKLTAILLVILCIVIALVLIFAFISFKRTMILKNSKEIFYRERLFNLLTNHTDDVFIIQDIEKGILNFVSENAMRILGIMPKTGEVADLNLLNADNRHFLLEKIDEMKHKDSHAIKDDEHEHMELEFAWIMPNTKEAKWMHMAIYHVVADFTDTAEACLIVVISDFTQVKENQQKLEEAMKQAQDAAQSKTLFLSNMSHEMRTPLNGIVGCIRMMERHLDDTRQLRDYLSKAESTANYLISLVSDILDMSKIESHKMTLEAQEISLRAICMNIDTMFRTQMEEKNITFQIQLDDVLYRIRSDEVRIQQILVNLLSNAVKFTNEGGEVCLQIHQELIAKDSVKTHFIVSDTGIGMSQSFLDRIWTPFEQERLDTARMHGGTGLGLAISYELAALMQGTITVTSQLNKGSRFHVEINQPMVSVDERESFADANTQEDKDCLRNSKILVAEDNDLNREILTTLLTELGAEVIEAENGQEAVQCFAASAEGEIDVILMDMQMPIMDGCKAASEIRHLKRKDAEEVVMIACTANAFQEDVERAKEAGMNDHIAKPLDMKKLIAILQKVKEEKQDEKE